jgi:hypothetical protein
MPELAVGRAVTFLVLAAGCGSQPGVKSLSDGGGILDCAWASGDNCWKQTIAAAAGCLPPSVPSDVPPSAAQLGVLSADGRTCSYASGQTVTFASPILVGGNDIVGDFTVTTAGAPCLGHEQGSSGITVTTSAGAVTLSEDPAETTFSVTCPDGTTYSGAVASLSSCQDALPGRSIGSGGFSGGDASASGTLSVELNGTTDPSGTSVFYCATP